MEVTENRRSRDVNVTPIIITLNFHSGRFADWPFVKRICNANISHTVVITTALVLIAPSVFGSMVLNKLFMTVIFL